MKERRKSKYAILKIFILVVSLGVSFLLSKLEPLSLVSFKSYMPGMEFKKKDIVDFILCMFIITLLLPPVQFLISLIGGLHQSIFRVFLDFYLGCSLSFFIGSVIKWVAGKERPDYADRVKSGNDLIIQEGRRSFPSGHAMMAFTGSFYLIYESILTIQRIKDKSAMVVVFYLGILMPVVVSCLIGYSRIIDNRHDIVDVFVGSVTGLIIPFIVSRIDRKEKKEYIIKR